MQRQKLCPGLSGVAVYYSVSEQGFRIGITNSQTRFAEMRTLHGQSQRRLSDSIQKPSLPIAAQNVPCKSSCTSFSLSNSLKHCASRVQTFAMSDSENQWFEQLDRGCLSCDVFCILYHTVLYCAIVPLCFFVCLGCLSFCYFFNFLHFSS